MLLAQRRCLPKGWQRQIHEQRRARSKSVLKQRHEWSWQAGVTQRSEWEELLAVAGIHETRVGSQDQALQGEGIKGGGRFKRLSGSW